MASFFNPRPRHLDATLGREVVYCHTCSHEWYRDESPSLSIVCPSCEGEITEIIELDSENDPRYDNGMGSFPNIFAGSRGGNPEIFGDDDYRDPFGPGSSPFRPTVPGSDRRRPNDGQRPGGPPGNDVLSRFLEMMMDDLGGGRVIRDAQGPGDLFAHAHAGEQRGGPRIHRTTYTSGPNTTTSVTFTSGPMPIRLDGDGPRPINFANLFGSLMGDPHSSAGPSNANQPPRGDGPGPGVRPPLGFAHLLASILSPGGFNGDAVYSQEELDRIITELMEHSPSNGPPPASQSAIENLEKKIVNDEMLGTDGRAECTICMDELNKGDEVTVLPCTHWYHGECVTLWLKEHNTCPICRKPVESQDAARNNSPRSPRSPGPQQSEAGPSSSAAAASTSGSSSSPRSEPNPNSPFPSMADFFRNSRERTSQRERETERGGEGSSSPRQSSNPTPRLEDIRRQRLESIRQAAGLSTDQTSTGHSSGYSSQRRSSVSPPGAWPENGTQSRVRSPSYSQTRENDGAYFGNPPSSTLFENMTNNRRSYATPSREQRESQQNSNRGSGRDNSGNGNGGSSGGGSSGHGLFSWVRDHFGRGSGNNSNNNNADKDRRRQ
ncbi:E3 ubiquitin-protein ligase RING1-like protein [Podospora australis]|uniref:RING-type E3 ubiquitin transferase n=1 Tax=Podospora australis TaxID=1536484 RepID=A0AAN6X169_9PEZI|nr:E3 ubiquitin-protein ligase RING1-like protein [Podospora australis]